MKIIFYGTTDESLDVLIELSKKNEILAESNLSKPNILAEVNVIPDLLTPGIKDNI